MLTVQSVTHGMMHIKAMEESHITQVCQIEKECFSNPWREADLRKQLLLATSHFLVAEIDGKAVGYMGLQIFAKEGYVTNVAVLPAFRKQGVARALIEAQLKHDMDFITLEVRQSNTPAIHLYAKMGFEKVGIRPDFYSNPDEDAIIMTKYF